MFQIVRLNNEPVLIDDATSKEFSLGNSFGIYNANRYLQSLNTGLDIKFNSYTQYSNLIQQINLKIDN